MPQQALRVRFHGGRHIHAAWDQPGDTETACGKWADPTAPHDWLDDAEVTCPGCQRALRR